MHDARTELEVIYNTTYVTNSNNTRWGSLRLTSTMELLYWIIIIAIKLQYDELLRVRPQ